MKIAFNPSTVAALTTPPNNKDITFDLRGQNIFARGVKFCGTDTNTWRDIKINNVSIGSHTLDLRNGSNTTLTNTNGVVTINSTWRPVVDNLTSDSTTSSLSANQGRVLAGLINGKSDSDHNHDDRYLKLTGGTMLLGEGLKFHSNDNYFGTNADARIISLLDDNDKICDGGLIIDERATLDGKEYVTELLRIRDSEFKWRGADILHSGNYSGILDSRYYTESEVNSLLSKKLDRVNLSVGSWNPRGYNLAADYFYNGGDLSISESGSQIHVSVDGYFWQNEGRYRVLDTSNVAELKGNLTVNQYLSSTDAAWWPLIWGGSSHNNTSNSTGAVHKSYDKLSWQTSSQTLYATNIQTENIKHLSIGGGIYWNSNVESATDSSDAASITLVKSGVAGGTTLVLSQMNDANDTIQFKTNGSARLYHNSYPILTTQNTYVSNNKGYINGTEITQVNNADKVDNRHAISTIPNTGIIYKAAIYTSSSLTSYWVRLASIPSLDQNGEFVATIHVQSGHFNPGRSAILLVYLRGGASSLSKSFKICCNSNYDPNRFRLYYKDSDKTSEIWYQTTGQWDGIITTVISQSSEGSLYEGLTLYSGSITAVQTPSMSTYLSAQVSTITDNISGNASTATKLATPRKIWGQSFDGTADVDNTLRIRHTTGNYCEGIRIQTGDGAWSTIILGATADSGTNANAWSIHRKSDNNFAISRNSSDGANGLVMTPTGMGLGTTSPTQRLDVAGNIRTTGNLYISHATNNNMNHDTSNPRIVFSESGSQAVGLVYTNYDSYRPSKGLKVMDTDNNDTSNVWFEVQGYNYSSGYVKNGSNDNYILLGGGGHKAISDFASSSHSHNYYWANVKISTSANTQTQPSVNTIYANNWFRSQGTSGWYSESYGGGIWMNDSNWIRTYGGKSFYCDNQIYSSISIRMSNILLEHTNEINNITNNGSINLNYRNSGNISLCQGGGNVGIGTMSPSYKLDVKGQVKASGFIHSDHSINDAVLLAGGGYGRIFMLGTTRYYNNTSYELSFHKLSYLCNNLVWVDGCIWNSTSIIFQLSSDFYPYPYANSPSMRTIYRMDGNNMITVDGNGIVMISCSDYPRRVGFFYTGRA